ncbi:MAG TPA: ferritin-like domain-containing protein [Gemmatimonadota bacterium]|nr:ferritin-like domain-containing protein [Gemmatimonadota bacterium]
MKNTTPLESLGPDILRRIATRRATLREAGKLGLGFALASVPLAIAASAKRAFAQGLPQEVVDVLNFALTLEYLENEFYLMGLASGVIPGSDQSIFQTIQDHEQAHVDFLVGALGSAAVDQPEFDFTAGGMFDPFNDYPTFRLLSQAFEDTGVRAYKGQAPALMGSDTVLSQALSIHSVEARHAARVRRLNGLQGWIPFEQPGVAAAAAAVYAGEDNTTHAGVNVTAVTGVDDAEITESFDEPLTMQQVLAIADPFIVG